MILFAVCLTTFSMHPPQIWSISSGKGFSRACCAWERSTWLLVDFFFERIQCFDAVECGRPHECDQQRSAWQRELKNTSGAFDIPKTLSFMQRLYVNTYINSSGSQNHPSPTNRPERTQLSLVMNSRMLWIGQAQLILGRSNARTADADFGQTDFGQR